MKKLLLLLFLLPALAFGQATGYVLSNFATSGSIGTAATTVDVYSRININQTTPSISLSVPNPTNTTTKVTEVWIGNIGTVPFTLNHGGVIDTASMVILKWTGANYTIVGKKPIGGGTVTSVTGTTNRITSTGGATPVIDIDASYAGQSSINTVGTVTTGTWQGTPIADAFVGSSANWNTAYTNRITSATAPLNITSNVISIPAASTSQNGYLSSTDWNTFNNKQPAFTSQSANLVYRSGNSGGVPTFSSLSLSDMPLFTGYTAGTTQQTVTSSDNAFSATQKLDGNIQLAQAKTEKVGLIFSDDFNRGSLGSNYTKATAPTSFAITSNELVCSGGSSYADYLSYNVYSTLLYKNVSTYRYRIGTVNTGGLAFGWASTIPLWAWLDNTVSSASVLKISPNGATTNIFSNSSIPNTLNCSSGDVIEMVLSYDDYTFSVLAKNTTTGESITATFEVDYATTDSNPKVSQSAVASMGGTHYVTLWKQEDFKNKYIDLLELGDSQTWGASSPVLYNSYADKMTQSYERVNKYCAPGLRIADITATCYVDLARYPKTGYTTRIQILLGINDFLGGATAASVITQLGTLRTTLQAQGYTVVLCTLIPNATYQTKLDSVNTYIRGLSATVEVLDFAKSMTTTQLSDGLHAGAQGHLNQYNCAVAFYANKLTPIKKVPFNRFTEGPRYSLNPAGNTSLSANILNTDTSIPVSSVAGMTEKSYYLITNGTLNEIVYAEGIIEGSLVGVRRGQLGTTALTVSATPSNYSVNVVSRSDIKSNILNSFTANHSTNQTFNGWNCNGPLLSAEEGYRFSLKGSSSPRFVVDVPTSGANLIFALNKSAVSSGSSGVYFGHNTNYVYQMVYGSDEILNIGRFSGSSPGVSIGASTNVGIFTKSVVYRLTNGGSDLSAKFFVDMGNSLTAGQGYAFDPTNGFMVTQGNGTRRIASAGFRLLNTTTTAGSEASDLGLYTQTAGAAMALRATVNSTGMAFQHLQGTGSAPTIAAGAGAGTGPTVSVSGTDMGGYITITTGTLPATSATVATITFNTAYSSAPKAILISPGNQITSALSGITSAWVEQSTISTTTFELKEGAAGLGATTTYIWYYSVIQ